MSRPFGRSSGREIDKPSVFAAQRWLSGLATPAAVVSLPPKRGRGVAIVRREPPRIGARAIATFREGLRLLTAWGRFHERAARRGGYARRESGDMFDGAGAIAERINSFQPRPRRKRWAMRNPVEPC